MPTQPFRTLGPRWAKLEPAQNPNQARTDHGKLPPNIVYPAGQVLAPRTDGSGIWAAPGAVIADPVVAPTFAANSAGALAAGDYIVAFSWRTARGETMISPIGTVTLLADERINVNALPAMPAGVLGPNIYVSNAPNSRELQLVAQRVDALAFSINALPAVNAKDVPQITSAVGPALSGAVADVKRVLQYPQATDADGRATMGSVSNPAEMKEDSVPMYHQGDFFCADLTGLTDANLPELGKLIRGATRAESGSIIRIGV